MNDEIPEWIKTGQFDREAYEKTAEMLKRQRLNTVCVEANCPNRYECFSKGTATFMILGSRCTRNCLYCNVMPGKPEPVDGEEPGRIAEAAKEMGIRHAVITCVTRDDLDDGGASQFIKVIEALKPVGCTVEVLISDLDGNWDALESVVKAKPDVLNHNIEVVEDMYPEMRPRGDYKQSLDLLESVKVLDPSMITKSGLMVGLGETMEQIEKTLSDLREARVDMITVGQYLRPSPGHLAVRRYYTQEEFAMIKAKALGLGFKTVESGPLVRSSYHAKECYEAVAAAGND
ncbi:MAG: lipoyl synthase [Candidatus Aenigmatarchaeota archaeon]